MTLDEGLRRAVVDDRRHLVEVRRDHLAGGTVGVAALAPTLAGCGDHGAHPPHETPGPQVGQMCSSSPVASSLTSAA